jgi:hypothetical protein
VHRGDVLLLILDRYETRIKGRLTASQRAAGSVRSYMVVGLATHVSSIQVWRFAFLAALDPDPFLVFKLICDHG